MKKVLSIFLIILLAVSTTKPALAATPNPVSPLYIYTSSVSASLPTIDTTTGIAVCTSKIIANQNTPVKVVCELQKYVGGLWATIKSWEATGDRQTAVQGKYAVYTGYWYRVKTTGYVYSSSNVQLETSTVTSIEQYYSGT